MFRDPFGRFVRELRHLVIKNLIPETDGFLIWSNDPAERRSGIKLDRAKLLEERTWHAHARDYMLDELDEDILIHEFVAKHRERVLGFCAWFTEAVERRNKADLDELDERAAEVAKAWKDAFGPPVEDPAEVP